MAPQPSTLDPMSYISSVEAVALAPRRRSLAVESNPSSHAVSVFRSLSHQSRSSHFSLSCRRSLTPLRTRPRSARSNQRPSAPLSLTVETRSGLLQKRLLWTRFQQLKSSLGCDVPTTSTKTPYALGKSCSCQAWDNISPLRPLRFRA